MMSESIAKLAESLAKAQGEIQNAAKDKENPFFNSSYADLASVWDACRAPLSKNGLSVVQVFDNQEGKIVLITQLLHTSGEYISSQIPIQPVKNDPQSVGSAITYFRRFALSALVGIAPAEKPKEDQDDEDDGNLASGKIIAPVKSPEMTLHELRSKMTRAVIEQKIPRDNYIEFLKQSFGTTSAATLTYAQIEMVITWIETQKLGKSVGRIYESNT